MIAQNNSTTPLTFIEQLFVDEDNIFYGRDKEIEKIFHIIIKLKKKDILIVGDSGIGKTSLIQDIAQRIINKNIPYCLFNSNVFKVDLKSIIFQENFSPLVFFQNLKKETLLILLIDDIDFLMEKTSIFKIIEVLNELKKHQNICLIISIHTINHKKFLDYYDPFKKETEILLLKEPSLEETKCIVQINSQNLQKKHNVIFTQEAIDAAVTLSNRFIVNQTLPGKVIEILDNICAKINFSNSSVPFDFYNLINDQRNLKLTKNNILKNQFETKEREIFTFLNQLNTKIHNLLTKYQEQSKEWQQKKRILNYIYLTQKEIVYHKNINSLSYKKLFNKLNKLYQELAYTDCFSLKITKEIVVGYISELTKIPLNIIESQQKRWDKKYLTQQLEQSIFGQSYGIDCITQKILESQFCLTLSKGTAGVFFIIGPNGIGKTETAYTLANILVGGEQNLIHLNMNEYQESHSISTLKSPSGYLGYSPSGIFNHLTNHNPQKLILMDNIDNAHPDILNIFNSIFKNGYLENADNIRIDFSKTYFVLTSSDCSKLIIEKFLNLKETENKDLFYENLHNHIIKNLNNNYGEEFIANTTVVPYMPLLEKDIVEILKVKLHTIEENIKQKYNVSFKTLKLSQDFLLNDFITSANSARSINHYLSYHVFPKISNALSEKYAN